MAPAPSRLDRRAYPFESRDLEVEGGRTHNVDEGEVQPVTHRTHVAASGLLALLVIAFAHSGCASAPERSPLRYRLGESGNGWVVSGSDRVLDDLRPRYAEFFGVILDPSKARVPNLLALRDDLERQPVDRRNFDALNAIAIGYYETNARAESDRGGGLVYLALSQRSAKLLAVPWRAYGETDEPALRSAILDFFEDAGSGRKRDSSATAPRLARIVGSLEKKEQDPDRVARIRALTQRLEVSPSASQLESTAP